MRVIAYQWLRFGLLTILCFGLPSMAVAAPAAAQAVAHLSVSTDSAAAQAAFDRGLTLIYAYDAAEAAQAFSEAATLDPGLAMAWWGVALANGADINTPPDTARNQVAARALQMAAGLIGQRSSAQERDYIAALTARYSLSDKPDFSRLAVAYRTRMRALAHRYADDPNAIALYGASIMDLRPWRLWQVNGIPVTDTAELVSLLEAGLARFPEHLGLLHFYIHAVEAGPHPERALFAAHRLRSSHFEGAASHLIHMPAHIYLRVGDWRAAIESNEHASHEALHFRQVTDASVTRACSHCRDFLSYAYTMQGQYSAAVAAADDFAAIEGDISNQISVLLRFRRFDELLAIPEPSLRPLGDGRNPHAVRAHWHYARGMSFYARHDLKSATTELAALTTEVGMLNSPISFSQTRPDIPAVYEKVSAAVDAALARIDLALLQGRVALARGDITLAIAKFRAAVALQDGAQYSEPPVFYYPVRETYAAALLKVGRRRDAERVLAALLQKTPHDRPALQALAALASARGELATVASLRTEMEVLDQGAQEPLEFEYF
jgi:hypothetical protein